MMAHGFWMISYQIQIYDFVLIFVAGASKVFKNREYLPILLLLDYKFEFILLHENAVINFWFKFFSDNGSLKGQIPDSESVKLSYH
jgi:hypothetical protein